MKIRVTIELDLPVKGIPLPLLRQYVYDGLVREALNAHTMRTMRYFEKDGREHDFKVAAMWSHSLLNSTTKVNSLL